MGLRFLLPHLCPVIAQRHEMKTVFCVHDSDRPRDPASPIQRDQSQPASFLASPRAVSTPEPSTSSTATECRRSEDSNHFGTARYLLYA